MYGNSAGLVCLGAGTGLIRSGSRTPAGRWRPDWTDVGSFSPAPARQGRPLRRPGALYQPCESVWNRAGLDSAVSIHSVERFLGDLALERDGQMTTTPTRIASSYSNT
jgi:hypothetical protein